MAKRVSSRLLIALLLLLFTLSAAQPTPPVVQTPLGLVQGYYDATQNVNRFNNLPYAQPPLGPLRWKPPVDLTSPLPSSPYPATLNTTIDCIQTAHDGSGNRTGQEDCLFVNIITPNPLPAANASLPVVAYICGGGFNNCYEMDAGNWIGRAQSFIQVILSFRLGVLGMFSLAEMAAQQAPLSYSGNQGLQDQQSALRWVKNNIAAFGGDPTRVTIQGESAGSMGICYHLIMPNSTGLFRSVVMESGACEVYVPWGSYLMSAQEAYGRTHVVERSSSNCGNRTRPDEVVSCMQALSVAELWELYVTSPPVPGITGDNGYWPTLDGVIVPDTPTAIFRGGRQNNVSVLIGTNTGETALWLLNQGPPVNDTYPYSYTQASIDEIVAYWSSNSSAVVDFYQAANYQRRYNGSRPGDYGHIFTDATTAQSFHCPARRVAKYMSAAGQRVFHYSWNYTQAGDDFAWIGWVVHARELGLVFYEQQPGAADEDAVLGAQVQNYWHRFFAYGDVNHADAALDATYVAIYGNHSLTGWPAFDYAAGNDHSMLIQNNSASYDHFAVGLAVHADQCDELWDKVVLLPVVEHRLTQCLHDECSTSADANNVCRDNYNSTYHCSCDSVRYQPSVDRQQCLLVAAMPSSSSSSSAASSMSNLSSSSSTTSQPSTSSSSSSSPSSSSSLYCSSSSSSSWSSSTGEAGDSGLVCGLWCYVAIALIAALSFAFAWMVFKMYTNNRKHNAAALAASTSPRSSSSAAPGNSSAGGPLSPDSDGGATDERSTLVPPSSASSSGGRVVRKAKKPRKVRVNTGPGLQDSLLVDDRA